MSKKSTTDILAQVIEGLTQEKEVLFRRCQNLEGEKDKLSRGLSLQDTRVSLLRGQLQDFQYWKLEELREKNKQLNDAFRDESRRATFNLRSCNGKEKKITKLERAAEETRVMLNNAKEALQQQSDYILQVKHEKEELRDRLERMESQKVKESQGISENTFQCDEFLDKLNELNTEITSLRAREKDYKESAEAKITTLTESLSRAFLRIEELKLARDSRGGFETTEEIGIIMRKPLLH